MRITVEIQPQPPTKTFRFTPKFAITYRDISGVIALCEDIDMAQRLANAFNSYDRSGIAPLQVRLIVDEGTPGD